MHAACTRAYLQLRYLVLANWLQLKRVVGFASVLASAFYSVTYFAPRQPNATTVVMCGLGACFLLLHAFWIWPGHTVKSAYRLTTMTWSAVALAWFVGVKGIATLPQIGKSPLEWLGGLLVFSVAVSMLPMAVRGSVQRR